MACVILPSETARLVYGYLVKENLNEIALQFLESSPFLTDCCQIVKSGYQFNTKLMGKDLQELLQEYSVIQNTVNRKVSLLCKSSLLYKRIKLRCESLPEIIELILFWKYKNSKSDENFLVNEKTEKKSNSQIGNVNCEFKNTSEVTNNKFNDTNVRTSECFNDSNGANAMQISDTSVQENLHSKLCSEQIQTNKEVEDNERNNIQTPRSELNEFAADSGKEKQSEFMSLNVPEISDTNENSNCSSTSIITNTNITTTGSSDPKLNMNSNVMTIDINPHSEDMLTNNISTVPLESNDDAIGFDNQIKIVRIEKENENENHALNVYSKSAGGTEGNMDLQNSSVVFVSPDVGNVTINRDRSQIIVIPIDYYKSQGDLHNEMEIINNRKQDSIQDKGIMEHQKSEIIFEGVQQTAASTTNLNQLYNDSNVERHTVDENIITEHNFLKNRQLLYNLEKELKVTPEVQPQPVPVHSSTQENVTVHPVAAPLILVSPTILPEKPQRYRKILPKKGDTVKLNPVIVIEPLVENNKNLTKKNSNELKWKARKKIPIIRKGKTKQNSLKNLNMPPIGASTADKTVPETVPGDSAIPLQSNEEPPLNEVSKETDLERRNEGKENVEKGESKKTETPVFVTRRNSKRLSLSTPRRKSHIRALEFETPLKGNEENKSKTSPKAKVEPVNVERKSVRNTLFKSPDPAITFKTPLDGKGNKKVFPEVNNSKSQQIEPLNELSIPIATRSPNTKLSDAWESLTGVGCVIGPRETEKTSPNKKMWDADLRCFVTENNQNSEPTEKKRMRKPEKNQKDNRKTTKKKPVVTKKSKSTPVTVSPSKMSLTAKRHTYSINGNEEGSPLKSLLDDLKIVTPFKDIEAIRPTEETPLTKLLRENVNNFDIDLSMINTPSFPPTPSIIITPDLDDVSAMPGANYYSPSKDCNKDKVLKITDKVKVDTSEKTNKKETKEMHEKVIHELVSKAKEIIGLSGENHEECMKRRPSGKILSMVKVQMLTQCGKKLCENIPINEENSFSNSFSNQTVLIGNLTEEANKSDLKVELEEKRKRALRKIKVVKENLTRTKNRVPSRNRKRKRSENNTKSDKPKSDVFKDGTRGKQLTDSDDSGRKEVNIFHSTPYAEGKAAKVVKDDSDKKIDNKILDDIRQEFPPFQDNSDKYPELTEKSRKKIHYVENFLKMDEIVQFVNGYNEKNSTKLFLKPALKRFFQIFYKWLKRPHKHEVNASAETKALLKEYLSVFDKINKGLGNRNKRLKKDGNGSTSGSNSSGIHSNSSNKQFLSDDDEREWKRKGVERRKDEDTEDGVVSILPLKKRKSTVQQVEIKTAETTEKDDCKGNCAENVSQTQNFLQDIDVDRFLSQIHGQENR